MRCFIFGLIVGVLLGCVPNRVNVRFYQNVYAYKNAEFSVLFAYDGDGLEPISPLLFYESVRGSHHVPVFYVDFSGDLFLRLGEEFFIVNSGEVLFYDFFDNQFYLVETGWSVSSALDHGFTYFLPLLNIINSRGNLKAIELDLGHPYR